MKKKNSSCREGLRLGGWMVNVSTMVMCDASATVGRGGRR